MDSSTIIVHDPLALPSTQPPVASPPPQSGSEQHASVPHSTVPFDDTDADSAASADSHAPIHPSRDTATAPTHLLSRCFLVKLFILFCSVIIFCVALMFAIEQWGNQPSNPKQRWSARRCTILSKLSQTNPRNSSQYRVTASVTGIGLQQQPVQAFYGPDAKYNLTRNSANLIVDRLPPVTTCYLSKSTPPRVSIVAVSSGEKPSSTLYIAWTATFVAAVMGILQLTFLSHAFHNCMGSRLPTSTADIAHPADAKTTSLTSRQTNYICDTYAEELGYSDRKDWACSICLEEDGRDGAVKAVRLPCRHVYHKRCIREWLRKGKAVCPLCNWDVKTLFDKNMEHPQGSAEESTANESEPHLSIDVVQHESTPPNR